MLRLWHINQSFAKNFSYLDSIKFGELKNRILSLSYEEDPNEFEKKCFKILKDLEEKNLEKRINYLKKMLEIKHQWSQAFYPSKCTGEVQTTSRAESMNPLLKHYVNSNTEISDVIMFLKNFEKKNNF